MQAIGPIFRAQCVQIILAELVFKKIRSLIFCGLTVLCFPMYFIPDCSMKCDVELCYIAHHSDCRLFIMCELQQSFTQKYQGTLKECAHGTFWAGANRALAQLETTCNTPQEVNCPNGMYTVFFLKNRFHTKRNDNFATFSHATESWRNNSPCVSKLIHAASCRILTLMRTSKKISHYETSSDYIPLRSFL